MSKDTIIKILALLLTAILIVYAMHTPPTAEEIRYSARKARLDAIKHYLRLDATPTPAQEGKKD